VSYQSFNNGEMIKFEKHRIVGELLKYIDKRAFIIQNTSVQ